MPDLEFTGERFIPGTADGEIAYEHWHRYAFARRYVSGKRVLDAACGEGYGTALLASAAQQALGVDIDAAAIAHAHATHGQGPNVRYETASVTALPLADASIDVVVSFETIEHIAAAEQTRMLAEFARVLAPGGFLILSSPNRRRYSDERGYRNPFHQRELYREELAAMLAVAFPSCRWFHQTRSFASALWSEEESGETGAGGIANGGMRTCEALTGDGETVLPTAVPDGIYHVVIAASDASALPVTCPALSLYVDRDESERKRADGQVQEVLRLDALLKDRDATTDRQTLHIRHLEKLVAERERIVVERDGQLVDVNAARESRERDLAAARASLTRCEADLTAARTRLAAVDAQRRDQDAALAAQERLITYQQSARWWIQLPWLAVLRQWRRWRDQ